MVPDFAPMPPNVSNEPKGLWCVGSSVMLPVTTTRSPPWARCTVAFSTSVAVCGLLISDGVAYHSGRCTPPSRTWISGTRLRVSPSLTTTCAVPPVASARRGRAVAALAVVGRDGMG